MGQDPKTGLDMWYCDKCGITFSNGIVKNEGSAGCMVDGNFVVNFHTEAGTENIVSESVSYGEHDMLATAFTLTDPDGDCTDGYTATLKCRNCDHTETDEGYSHFTYYTIKYDLADYGLCDVTVTTQTCACGLETTTDATGVCGTLQSGECEECGGSGVFDSAGMVPKVINSCITVVSVPLELYNSAGEPVLETELVATISGHKMLVDRFELDVEDGTCEDGYTVWQTCLVCGKTESEWKDTHDTYSISYLDLKAAGGRSMCRSVQTVLNGTRQVSVVSLMTMAFGITSLWKPVLPVTSKLPLKDTL